MSPITDRTRVNIKITSADNVWSETYKVRLRRMGNPVQAPATGTVTVAGDPVVGGTLEASVSNVTDPNGTFFAEGGRPWYGPDFIRNYGFHFVWHADRSTSGNTVYIVGQGRRLVLTRHMLGQRISVNYAFTDDLDNDEVLYSPETEAVQAEQTPQEQQTGTGEPDPLTARFAAMPAEHDGESRFRFRLVFSDEIFDGTEPLNKNRAVRDALAVTGGAATGSSARRQDRVRRVLDRRTPLGQRTGHDLAEPRGFVRHVERDLHAGRPQAHDPHRRQGRRPARAVGCGCRMSRKGRERRSPSR